MKKLLSVTLFIILCCFAFTLAFASGADDEYIQNIIVKYAQFVGNLKHDEASVIFDAIGYPYKEVNPNLSMLNCNEGTISFIFVKQETNANTPEFLGELSYTGDGYEIMITCMRFGGQPEYTIIEGWSPVEYPTLEAMINAYNVSFDASIQTSEEN